MFFHDVMPCEYVCCVYVSFRYVQLLIQTGQGPKLHAEVHGQNGMLNYEATLSTVLLFTISAMLHNVGYTLRRYATLTSNYLIKLQLCYESGCKVRIFTSRCAVVRASMFRVLVCSFHYTLYTDLLWTGIATEFHMLKCTGPFSVPVRENLDKYAAKRKRQTKTTGDTGKKCQITNKAQICKDYIAAIGNRTVNTRQNQFKLAITWRGRDNK
jgi:hypothetical protein